MDSLYLQSMSHFPPVLLTYTQNNQPTVVIDNTMYNNWSDVVAKVGGVDQVENALIVARMLTHFSHRSRFKVIDDPLVYETAYLKRVAGESAVDPAKPKMMVRAAAMGIPDFAALSSPQIVNHQLTFYVYDTALLVPYKVVASPTEPDITKQVYTLLALTTGQ